MVKETRKRGFQVKHYKRMLSMIRLAAVVAVMSCLSATSMAYAQESSGSERITNYKVNVRLTKDNVVQVTEDITYDFGGNSRHGIYRDIPVKYHDGNDTYYMSFTYGGTHDENGAAVKAQITNESGNKHIRLGDPDRLLNGVHHYAISYSLSPMVYQRSGVAFLNMDVIGTGFQVPIDQADVTIETTDGTAFEQPQCFSGSQGDTGTGNCVVTQTTPGKLAITTSGLQAYQGVTINANLPNGYISNYLQPNKKPPLTLSDVWGIVRALFMPMLFVLIFGGVFVVLGLRWGLARRKRKDQIVVAQYDPPTSMTPAEIGHLEDDSSSTAEVTATVIDLARRGHLKITQLEAPKGINKFFGGTADYQIDRLNVTDPVSPLEQNVLDALFSGLADMNTVRLKKLNKQKAAERIQAFKSAIKDSLTSKGFYAAQGGLLSKGNLTDAGAKEWALVDGFKLYITVVEKDRLAFTDAPAKTPERFSALLPYAIALGVEKEWAKQFEGIDITPATNSWYAGNNMSAFSAATFANTLDSSFASTLSSNTSISSSGGSSGGGGGGGGGGSW